MDLELSRPDGLDDGAWESINQCQARLVRALDDDDYSLVLGCAKELVEATAKVVLDARGSTPASNADFHEVVKLAQAALERQPGVGLSADPPVRNIAQGAQKIATELREIRNRYGTGHGRSTAPDVADELVHVSVDAAMLWTRWALRRLEHVLSGSLANLVRDLREGGHFTRKSLAKRLEAADVPALNPTDQHHLGVALAQRAMQGTFIVKEVVEACAKAPNDEKWPPAYRAGLVEGLILDRDGYVSTDAWAVSTSAILFGAHFDAASVLSALLGKIREAEWSYEYAQDAALRTSVMTTMFEMEEVLPSPEAKRLWNDLADLLRDRAASR